MSTPQSVDRKKKLEEILRAAKPLMMRGYSANPGADRERNALLKTSQKSSFKDLVTVFDQAVEDLLMEEFSRHFPGEVVIGEEQVSKSGKSPQATIRDSPATHFWLVDPIDGTTNYSRAYPFFCTTAAYCEKSGDGWNPIVGAVYNPVTDEMFSAALGHGAFLNDERMLVSEVREPAQALMITGFASNRSQDASAPFELFTKITRATLGVRRDGSAALDLAYVAAGRCDAYWEYGLAPWDTAAGTLLVQEARGKVSDLEDQSTGLARGEILASNGFLHKWVLDRLYETKR